ncbi:prolyl oligopeptidase family serine peptidase [Paenisporosarcina sp. TG-14]|uniref:prolyl oligopeptidase family serine peptidase n=1 Tax=Paenisporosarcina sp. TG-14 TaxID=1231057 RepID=UPI0002ED7D2C|nr:prolyl oligopeptidase family serine peptidase [Paenisporosarcina sp. TG-14]
MKVVNERWGNIPLLHVYRESEIEKQVPVVIFLHGFTSAKEHNLHYAYQLAEKGLRVLLPDAHLHGERQESLDEVELSLRFWEITLTSIEEVNLLRGELVERNLIDNDTKIGLAGTSMGGIVTLGCLKVYPWIDTTAVMMGSPSYVHLAKAQMSQYEARGFKLPITDAERKKMLETLSVFDITLNPDALDGRPVFFWHGKADNVVQYEPTFNFYNSQKKLYDHDPRRFQFMTDKTASHAVSRKGMLAATDFVAHYLSL